MISATPSAIYLVCDHRQGGGPLRVVSQHADPRDALAAADALRRAGDAAEILLATAYDEAQA